MAAVAEEEAAAAAAVATVNTVTAAASAVAPVSPPTFSPSNHLDDDDTLQQKQQQREQQHHHHHFDGRRSQASTPTTRTTPTSTSPASTHFLSVADRVSTPLSLFSGFDSAPNSSSGQPGSSEKLKPRAVAVADADSVRDRYLAMSRSPAAAAAARPLRPAAAAAAAVEEEEGQGEAKANSVGAARSEQGGLDFPLRSRNSMAAVISAPSPQRPQQRPQHPLSPLTHARGHQHERPQHAPSSDSTASNPVLPALPVSSLETTTTAATPDQMAEPLHVLASSADIPAPLQIFARAARATSSSTGSIARPTATVIAHPKPILRASVDSVNIPIKHPIPDLSPRSVSALDNIAQLEATAERLSMTSSIDDAIRELHGELKRSDSKRSSKLAASVRAASSDENSGSGPGSGSGPINSQLKRQLSTSSSIVSTNNAARQGGYSPAAFVMSPSGSMTGRMRSGSKNSSGRPELDLNAIITRHGPGKSSVRSVRSGKPSLAEISESEPISLTQDAFDAADAAPPIEHQSPVALIADGILQHEPIPALPATDAFHQMLESTFAAPANLDQLSEEPAQADYYPNAPHHHQMDEDDEDQENARPTSSGSGNTFQQAQEAFIDFDGVHCDSDGEDQYAPSDAEHETQLEMDPEIQPETSLQRVPSNSIPRPQAYFDPETGQKMLYYPARVPAMLNLPPKLSAKPRVAQRDQRRSQILSTMMDGGVNGHHSRASESHKENWLPDPLSGHRNSFAVLAADELQGSEHAPGHDIDPEYQQPTAEPLAETETASESLRRPQRLSKMDLVGKHKSKISMQLDKLPAQLRASVFFDLPSSSPEVEVKDGSAMATLDSILDASARAPVSAFTDHVYAGKLGKEVYGKEKKHKANASVPSLGITATDPPEPKKRASFMWLGKRSSSYNSEEKNGQVNGRSHSMLSRANEEVREDDDQHLGNGVHDETVRRLEGMEPTEGELGDETESEGEIDGYQGPPTTLLAELQLRKQQQRERVRGNGRANPEGMRATLLEMDAVLETQSKNRKTKRVNLAWEDTDANIDQNGTDDEDVPLAILAAMHHGAKNLADLERPLGLMEKREIEENEPLSQRRARLQGRDSTMILPKRQSMMTLPMSLPPTRLAEVQPAQHPLPTVILNPGPESPQEAEIESETLGDRKRRLADGQLPRARPVSSAFSTELLSQFGDLDEPKLKSMDKPAEDRKESVTPNMDGEEETLGQRRRRLQAEKEARDREMMSYGNNQPSVIPEPARRPIRRVSMADILAVHQKKDVDRPHDERWRQGEQTRVAIEHDAKMAAMRKNMPTVLTGPDTSRSSGFKNGAYNDGTGGLGSGPATRSTTALHTHSQSFSHVQTPKQPNGIMGNYGAATPQMKMHRQQSHGSLAGYGNMGNMSNMGGYNTANTVIGYNNANTMAGYNNTNTMNNNTTQHMSYYGGNPAGNMYGGGAYGGAYGNMMQPGMQLPVNHGASMDRVERWRQSILP